MIEAVEMAAVQTELQLRIEPLLLEVADVVNTTLDLDTTLRRVAEVVRKVIDYEIFGILLLNEKAQELYFRFSVGHSREVVERLRIKVGEGVTGVAVPSSFTRLDIVPLNVLPPISLFQFAWAAPGAPATRVAGVNGIGLPPPSRPPKHMPMLFWAEADVATSIERLTATPMELSLIILLGVEFSEGTPT